MSDPKFQIGDRVRMGKSTGTVINMVGGFTRWLYDVKFDDVEYSRIPPQVAIGVRDSELEKIA